jgi:hypothetical protein
LSLSTQKKKKKKKKKPVLNNLVYTNS